MSGRRRLRLSQETIRYPSRDSVSLKNPEEIPLHLQKTGLMGDCRECSLRGDGDPFDRLVQKSIRKILLDISDFSSIIFLVRKMGSLYPPWRTRGRVPEVSSRNTTEDPSQSKELSRMDAGSCSPTRLPKEGNAGKEAS